MKQVLKCFREGSNDFMRNIALTVATCAVSLSAFAQPTVINNYYSGENLKNYSVEEVPGSNGNEMMMAGTIFGAGNIANPRPKTGEAIHYMYTDGQGNYKIDPMSGAAVGVRYDFTPEYHDVRCVDIVPYTSTEALIVVQARALNHPNHMTRDLLLVLKVNIADGTILNTYEVASNLPQAGDYANIYGTHAIYHEVYVGGVPSGDFYLYICGYDAMETQLGSSSGNGYPDFIPQIGPSCFDKRILLIKFDIDNIQGGGPQVVSAKTYDKPWPTCTIDATYPEIYDFDIAMRLVPLDDGSGDLYVTGSTNSDYAYDDRYSAFPASYLSYGSATLSLRVDEAGLGGAAFNTVALRPFIENKILPFGGPTPQNLRMFEHGYGAFEDNVGTGLYVFSNTFEPDNTAGYGYKTMAEQVRMTYINKATLGFGTFPSINRIAFGTIDYNWGTQVLRSPNGTDKVYLAGLQSGWDYGNCGNPANGNNPPLLSNNINPFMAEIEPTYNLGTNLIGITNINFWKTYFTQNNTGYFDDLGGGFSNITWATEFVASNPSQNNISFMAPKWDNFNNTLNMKYYRTDNNGDLSTGLQVCDDSYQDCISTYADIDIVDGWWMQNEIEDYVTLTTQDGNKPHKLFIPPNKRCNISSEYKSSGVANANTKGLDKAKFEVYPNPANTYVSVKVTGEVQDDAAVNVTLYNVMGQHVGSLYNGTAIKLKSDYRMELPSSLAAGVYVLKITSNGKELHTQSVSIQ